MTKEQKKITKKHYTKEFKDQAVELAKDIGAQEAAVKLGIKSYQTLSNWIRYSKKLANNDEFRELEDLKKENKKLKKELDRERKVTAILKDATAFFCQDQLK
jgi:transposase